MARPKVITIVPQAPDDNGIAESQTSGGGNLTLNGDLVSGGVATFSFPVRIGITSAGDDSGLTFTVTGTGRFGNTITESVSGAATDEAVTLNNFATVTQVAVDDTTDGTVIVGPSNVFETQWVPQNRYRPYRSYRVTLTGTPSLTYTLQHTLSDLQKDGFEENSAVAFADADVASETSSQGTSLQQPISGSRLAVSSYATGGIVFEIVDPASGS